MIQRIYSLWVISSFIILFLILFIPLAICIPFKSLHRPILWLNYAWAWAFFKVACIPVEKEWRFTMDKGQQYILCANHFSYLDIPALGLFPQPFKFVGKSQLKKIPVFGLIYDGLHITVDRKSYRSRAKSLEKARKAILEGLNLGFFPEGGIRFKKYPIMVPLKDGAFRLACERRLPIVPITFPNNHFILPDDGRYLIQRKTCKIVYHEPIWSDGNTDQDIKALRIKVGSIIQSELSKS